MKTIYLTALPKHEIYHYEFICPQCDTEVTLATGTGRYGNLGGFSCSKCGTEYYATIDDHPRPKLYVNLKGQQPAVYLEGNANAMIVLSERDGKE